METTKETQTQPAVTITPDQLLEHWQGHRRLTRRVIEAFPEDKLLSHSVGGMRPFAELAFEMLSMAGPGIKGIATGKWNKFEADIKKPTTKAELLQLWDEITNEINTFWKLISPQRFQETDTAFGQWTGTVHWILFYFIDNEIHHRGQGYVYLRSLGIEPPPFWDRN